MTPRFLPNVDVPPAERMRVAFVNSGILGLQSFSKYIREAMALDPYVDARHINLTEHMTVSERFVRLVMCARLWPDGFLGYRNLDFARLRQEYHAGFQAALRLRKLMAEERIDVLHFHRQATAYGSLGLMRNVPTIVSIDCTQDVVLDDADTALERWTYAGNVAMDGRIMNAASAIVSTSNWAADCLKRRYPECGTPVHIMPSPVRTAFFDGRWIDERFERARQGEPPRVLFVGGDFVRKGGDDLLSAWKTGEFHRVATLYLVTDWPLDVSRVPGVQVLKNVASYTSEWSELWRMADILVLPTRSEAFANVLQEAGAAGLPSIGTRLNAVPEIVEDGVTGFLVPPRDPPSLANALRALVESPGLRRDLGAAARTRVLGRADPDEYHSKLRHIIQSVASTRPRTPRTPRTP